MIQFLSFFFFFSSRRRHTRCSRDWSSDVCSSDLTSSGTGAMEGALANLLSPGERVLVGTAGEFGERWLELAEAYGAPAVKGETPFRHPLDVAPIGRRLKNDRPFRAVFVQAKGRST